MGLGEANAQSTPPPSIHWIDIEKAVELNKSQPKKMMIYVYSNSCGWCTRFQNTTFSNPVIVDYLNQHFYAVKLNSNLKKDITLGQKTYHYIQANPEKRRPAYHELIVNLLQGRLAYPSVVWLNENLVYLSLERGYRNPADFESWIHFIAEEAYLKNNDFDAYDSTFQGKLK